MKYFVFRNNTVEFFFDAKTCAFSGYGDISVVPQDADRYIWFYQPPYGVLNEKSAEMVRSYMQSFDLVYSRIPAEKELLVFTLCDIGSTGISSGDFSFVRIIIEPSLYAMIIRVIGFRSCFAVIFLLFGG